jgi:hypothetical protein
MTALITAAAIVASLAPSAWAVIRARDSGRRRYRQDMRHIGHGSCDCCGAVNTRVLRLTDGQRICKDRALCRAAMIYANMLDQV